MARQDAVEYIKKVRKNAFRDEEIRRELEKSGWPKDEIDLAFIESRIIKMPPMEVPIEPPQIPSVISKLSSQQQKPQPLPVVTQKPEMPVAVGTSIPINKPTSSPSLIQQPPSNTAFLPQLSKKPSEELPRPAGPPARSQEPPRVQPTNPPREPIRPMEPPPPLRAQMSSRENVVETLMKEGASPTGAPRIFTNTPQRKHINTKTIIGSFLALVCVASAAGGGYWYYEKIYPKQVLSTALASLKTMKTYHFDTTIEVHLKENTARVSEKITPFIPQVAGLFLNVMASQNQLPNTPTLPSADTFTARLRGDIDRNSTQDSKYDLFFTLETHDILASDIELEGRGVGGVHYFQFTKLPRIPKEMIDAGFAFPIDTESFEKKWVSFNPKTVQNSVDDYMKQLSSLDSSFQGYFQTQDAEKKDVSGDQIARIQTLFDSAKVVTWGDDANQESVKGERTYRFKGTLDKPSLESIVTELARIGGKDPSTKDLSDIHNAVDLLGNPEFNIWVSRDTQRVMKTTMVTSVRNPSGRAHGVSEVLLTTHLTNVDKPISITAPRGAYDFQQVLNSTFKYVVAGLNDAQMRGRDARRTADIKQIQLALELYKDKNSSYPISLAALEPEYIVLLPKDPQTKKSYTYKRLSYTSYTLSVRLEDPQNSNLQNDAKPGDQNFDVKP